MWERLKGHKLIICVWVLAWPLGHYEEALGSQHPYLDGMWLQNSEVGCIRWAGGCCVWTVCVCFRGLSGIFFLWEGTPALSLESWTFGQIQLGCQLLSASFATDGKSGFPGWDPDLSREVRGHNAGAQTRMSAQSCAVCHFQSSFCFLSIITWFPGSLNVTSF